jgi:cytochrome c biogenesis protein ResB
MWAALQAILVRLILGALDRILAKAASAKATAEAAEARLKRKAEADEMRARATAHRPHDGRVRDPFDRG